MEAYFRADNMNESIADSLLVDDLVSKETVYIHYQTTASKITKDR